MDLVRVLESYRGHDRIIRLCTYVGLFISGDRQGHAFDRIRAICSEFSGCRVILRLFDDLSMLMLNLSYGTGAKEKSVAVRILSLIGNIANQLFYPVEHIAWLADRNVINTDSKKLFGLGVLIWATSLLAEILKSLVSIRIINTKIRKLKKEQYLESTDESREEPFESVSTETKALKADLKEARLILIQSAADFMNAINWLPPGILWSGKFSRSWSGLFGIISTTTMLYRNWPTKS